MRAADRGAAAGPPPLPPPSMPFELEAPAGAALSEAEAAAVVARVDRHLVPWLFSLGVVCYLDRTSLAFSAAALTRDLGLDCAT
jgi:hypothetical protein